MSGTYDLLLFVEGPTLREVAAFVSERLSPLEGVLSTSTHFMLKTYKRFGVLMHPEILMNGSLSLRNRISATVRDIPRSGIRDFFDIVTTMKDVISLGIGEPDFDTPWHVRESTVFALERGATHYTSNLGYLELRRALARYVAQDLRRRIQPRERNPRHRRRQRGAGPGPAGAAQPRRRGALPRAVLCVVSGDDSFRARRAAGGRNARRERVPPHARDAGGEGDAAHQGADAQFPEQPDRRRHGPGGPGGHRRFRPRARPDRHHRTRFTAS